MKSALVPLAPGFEQIEAVTIIGVLRRAGVDVTVAATTAVEVESSHGLTVHADATLEQAAAPDRRFDAVVLPGGMPGAAHLRDDERVRAALQRVVADGGIAAAVCAAPIALEAAGLLEGRRATAHPRFRDQLGAADVQDANVVVDLPIVTGAGPGPAMAFSLAVVEALLGQSAAADLRAQMVVT